MNNQPMQEEMTIDLLDFLGKFLSKWKQIVLCMLAGMLLVSVYGYFSASAKAKAAAEAARAPAENPDEFSFTSITQEEGEQLLQMAKRYRNLIDDENTYLENSVLMNLPDNTATVYCMQYSIGGSLKPDQKHLLMKAYSLAIENDTVYQKVSEALAPQYNVKPTYIGELISTSSDTMDNAFISSFDISTVSPTSASSNLLSEVPDDSSSMYQIYINGYDEAFCKTIADIVDSAIRENTPALSQLVNHTIKSINSQSYSYIKSSLLTDKSSRYAVIKTATDNMATLTKSLTDDEKSYVNSILSGAATGTSQPEASAVVEEPSLNVPYARNAAIGLLLGLVLVGAWFALSYLASSKIHTTSELEEYYGQTVLGTIPASKPERKFTNVFDRIPLTAGNSLPKETSMELIKQAVCSMAKSGSVGAIGISCLACGDEAQALCKELATMLSTDGRKATAMDSVLSGREAMRTAANVDALILVEALENTSASELKETLKYFNSTNQPILGAVILK